MYAVFVEIPSYISRDTHSLVYQIYTRVLFFMDRVECSSNVTPCLVSLTVYWGEGIVSSVDRYDWYGDLVSMLTGRV